MRKLVSLVAFILLTIFIFLMLIAQSEILSCVLGVISILIIIVWVILLWILH